MTHSVLAQSIQIYLNYYIYSMVLGLDLLIYAQNFVLFIASLFFFFSFFSLAP